METISVSLKFYSPGFWCVYSMYGNTQRMRRLYHCVCLKQSLRDGRSVCAAFHSNALCQSAFTQLLNNTCMIREKSHQCIKYIKYFTLDGDGNSARIEKKWWPTFFRAHSCCFFFLSTLSLCFPLETLPPLYSNCTQSTLTSISTHKITCMKSCISKGINTWGLKIISCY